MGVRPLSLEQASKSYGLSSAALKSKVDGIRTPIGGYEAEIDSEIETPRYYNKDGRLIHDWKFIQRPVLLTKGGKNDGVYLVEIKPSHYNLSAILKEPDEIYRLENEICNIATLPRVKHLIASLYKCELVNGTSPDRLAGFFLNRKGLMENEYKHLSLVHVEGRLYERLLENHAIDHFTHDNVPDAITDNGNFRSAAILASKEPPTVSHLRLFTGNSNNEAPDTSIYYS
ncbi:MAG: hypothetical protein A3I68_06565 [Candidatus Melainabacteria bacterium RIFCSPLOWO2_02_FULL_35_15]|nr:MAG: hypothetical protein A3F80_00085 [Candidatus Melainabacteria bacterium RIFCSPLOWO2_12_FULL_35_11]OGI13598.1 MAG: hypothetical protein A3I68_06565 [Candidatus Melainabacteria bacterium RIFCSPLOWO2_02_FULL_35_15]